MKKRILTVILAVAGLIMAVPSGIYILSLIYQMFFAPSSGIGIIGGADGPTAIFLASSLGVQLAPLIAAIALICGIICLIIVLILLLKKDK